MAIIKKLFSAKTAIAALLLTLLTCSSFAQFGQNKVQYKVFNWKFLQTKHFDIYFSQEGEYIAQFTAVAAESSLVKLESNIGYKIQNRIPILVFNSHNDFQQNNALDEYMPEGVGGVTELFKNRILVPFEGDYDKFRHVIHHELLHAFMNDMYYGGSIQNIISQNIKLQFPIWFSEGMAEYQSLDGNDKANDMFLRDAVIYDYMPDLEYINGYLAYRGGQSFFSWLADEYGKEKIGDLMQSIKAMGDVEDGFRDVYKLDLRELSDKWHKYLKQTYWPDYAARQEVTDFANRLTDSRKGDGFYNTGPSISPDGKKIVYISNRADYFDLYLADVKTGRIISKLAAGNSTANYEELHLITPGVCWSPDSRFVVISVKSGDRDAIHVINVATDDEKILPTKFDGIFSLSWNAKTNSLVFIGDNSHQSDLYIYNFKTKKLEQVTNDVFSDSDPSWSRDGTKIYFTSDRANYTDLNNIPRNFKMSNHDYTEKDIYAYDIATKTLKRLNGDKNSTASNIVFSEDGKKALYISDKSGINNIWMRDLETGEDKPITNSIDPINLLSISADGKRLAFNALNRGGYDIFYIDNPFDIDLGIKVLPMTAFVEEELKKAHKNDSVNFALKKDSVSIADSIKSTVSDSSRITHDDTALDLTLTSDTAGHKNTVTDTTASVKNITENHKNESLSPYGNEIGLNLNKNYDDTLSVKYLRENVKLKEKKNPKFDITENTNDDSSFKINKYKIKFSPDVIYSNVNYSTFYGVQGIIQLAFSDITGNHRIYATMSAVLDLKNSDYSFAYYYLPKRIDYGIQAYHTARFLLLGNALFAQLYRYRQYGANVTASFPITKFNRLDGTIGYSRLTKENMDDPTQPMENLNYLLPVLSYVHDNTLFGYTAPVRGTRYNITALGTPKIGTSGVSFMSVIGDYRTYLRFFDDYNFVFRFNAGYSFGKNPQRFYVAGTENWINYTMATNNLPIEDIEDFAFSTPIMPLRGFDFNERSGSKYALMNAEFRFPLFRYLVFGALPLAFQNIQGVAFLDVGTVWSNNRTLQLLQNTPFGVRTKDLLVGMGFGARIFLLYFPLKFDVAWSYNGNSFSQPKYYISLGGDF